MADEIPQFRTCAICKRAKAKEQVKHIACLDDKDVKICGACLHAYEHDSTLVRQFLLESTAEFGTNV